jgi:hypothetical protein
MVSSIQPPMMMLGKPHVQRHSSLVLGRLTEVVRVAQEGVLHGTMMTGR